MVRHDDDHHETLSAQLPEIVARYPEHAECAYFVTFDEPASADAAALFDAIARGPLPARRVVLVG